jgi:hypothetical protein
MRAACVLALFLAGGGLAESPYGSIKDLKLAKTEDGKDAASKPAPKGAVVLFDGKGFDAWTHRDGKTAVKWNLVELPGGGKAMQVVPGTSDIISKEKFPGPFLLHVEFRVPYMPKAGGQGRGNSGVYAQGRYEVQVLDSYGIRKPGMNDCGAIYSVAVPKSNACKAPTVWQAYDIAFTPPACKDGKKVRNGRMTVTHNGVKIHDNQEITRDVTTSGIASDVCTPGPVLLQDHGNPVQYRNVWILPRK